MGSHLVVWVGEGGGLRLTIAGSMVRGWSIATHRSFTPPARATIRLLCLVIQRQREAPPLKSQMRKVRGKGEDAPFCQPVAVGDAVPDEIWLLILAALWLPCECEP